MKSRAEKKQEYDRIRYATNAAYREARNRASKLYYQNNKEAVKAYAKKWAAENRARCAACRRKKYHANLEKSRAKSRKYAAIRRHNGKTAIYQRSLPKPLRNKRNRQYRAKVFSKIPNWYLNPQLKTRYGIEKLTKEQIEHRRSIILLKRTQKIASIMKTTAMLSALSPVVSQESQIAEFASLVQQGIDAWTKAGDILVTLIDEDAGVINKITKAYPAITKQMLQAFEKIGRKIIYAPLLADTSVAARALLELPFTQQQKYFTNPIETVVGFKDQKPVTKLKRLDEMSRDDVKMVFGRGCIHDIEQQAFRYKELEKVEIQKEKPRPKFVDYKTVEVGYYYITLDNNGEVKVSKAPTSANAHSIRLVPYPNGEKAAVVLFYREPR